MFEAIRRKLIGAWRDLRSRGLITLFFFELLVVTLGVILAQAAAGGRATGLTACADGRWRPIPAGMSSSFIAAMLLLARIRAAANAPPAGGQEILSASEELA